MNGTSQSVANNDENECMVISYLIFRACLITLHSNFEIFQKGHPAVEFMIDRRIFER